MKVRIKPAIGIITDSEMFRTMAKTPGEKIRRGHANGGCYLANLVVDGLKHPPTVFP